MVTRGSPAWTRSAVVRGPARSGRGGAGPAPKPPSGRMPRWLRDSKQLSEARRESIFESVGAWCVDWAVGHASPRGVRPVGDADRPPTRRAAGPGRAGPPPRRPPRRRPAGPGATGAPEPGRSRRSPVRCTRSSAATPRCASVAAASVLAKVVRDRLMRAESEHFPAYAFEQNKGYPSPTHQMALRGYGLSTIHRRSWSYVAGLPWCDAGRSVAKTTPDQGRQHRAPFLGVT